MHVMKLQLGFEIQDLNDVFGPIEFITHTCVLAYNNDKDFVTQKLHWYWSETLKCVLRVALEEKLGQNTHKDVCEIRIMRHFFFYPSCTTRKRYQPVYTTKLQ